MWRFGSPTSRMWSHNRKDLVADREDLVGDHLTRRIRCGLHARNEAQCMRCQKNSAKSVVLNRFRRTAREYTACAENPVFADPLTSRHSVRAPANRTAELSGSVRLPPGRSILPL